MVFEKSRIVITLRKVFYSVAWSPSGILYTVSSFFSCTLLGLDNNLALMVWFQDLPFLPPETGQLKLELQPLAGKRDGQ